MGQIIVAFDRSELKGAHRTEQGFLRVPGFATRTGVFKYKTSDGKVVRQLRLPEEVFSKESLDSLRGIPLTDDHPMEFVTPSNAKKYMVGYTGDSVMREGNMVRIEITITDADVINKVESKKLKELSLGYRYEVELKQGVYDGEEYDMIQRNIRHNHLALVDKGRAGPAVRLVFDSGEAEIYVHEQEQDKEKIQMENISIDGKEYKVSPEVKVALEAQAVAQKAKLDASEKKATDSANELNSVKEKLTAETAAKDKAQATADSQKVELEKLKNTDSAADFEKKVAERVTARIAVLSVGKKFITDKNIDSMSDKEIKLAVIKVSQPNFKAEDKSESYIDGAFEATINSFGAHPLQKVGTALANKDSAAEENDSEKRRSKFMQESNDAWKQPLSVKA